MSSKTAENREADGPSPTPAKAGGDTLELRLEVRDPEVVAELLRQPEGAERNEFARRALRLGVIALRGARGDVDAVAVRHAGQQLVGDVRELLANRSSELAGQLASTFKQYLDPDSGVLQQRLEAHLDPEHSTLARTLAAHLGEDSPVFKMLSPEQADGLKAQLERAVGELLADQRNKLLAQFTLDDEQSALSRLKRELDKTLGGLGEANEKFQREVMTSLTTLTVRREEEQRSTRHGATFEERLGEVLVAEAQRLGDPCEPTGNTTGVIKNCKVGDFVITLGPEAAAAGARMVVEAKEDRSYTTASALAEMETARKNRGAQVGVFVFSSRTAPEGLEALVRYGDDLLVVWDADDPQTDLVLRAAISAARALLVRDAGDGQDAEAALGEVARAVRAVEKQANRLEQFRKWAETIKNNSEHIIKDSGVMRDELVRQVAVLDEQLAALRRA